METLADLNPSKLRNKEEDAETTFPQKGWTMSVTLEPALVLAMFMVLLLWLR